MNSLIDYTDKAIMRMVLDQVQQINPWVKIGEAIEGPCETVADGKVIRFLKDEAPPTNYVSLKNGSSYITAPVPTTLKQAITAQSVKLHLDDIANFRMGGLQKLDLHLTKRTWFHPYSLEIPSREWLEEYKLGDIIAVAVIDPITFQTTYVQTPLTQQMIDDHSEVLFRFALSDY